MGWVQKWNIVDDFYWYNTTTGKRSKTKPYGVTTPSLEPDIAPPPWAPTPAEFKAAPTWPEKKPEEFAAEVKFEQERMEATRILNRRVQAKLGMRSPFGGLPSGVNILKAEQMADVWAEGFADITAFKEAIWTQVTQPFLAEKTGTELKKLRETFQDYLLSEKVPGKGPMIGQGLGEKPQKPQISPGIKSLSQVRNDVNAAIARKDVRGNYTGKAKTWAEDPDVTGEVITAVVKSSKGEELTDDENKLFQSETLRPKINKIIEDIAKDKQRAYAIRLAWEDPRLRRNDLYFAAIGTGMSDEQAKNYVNASEYQRLLTITPDQSLDSQWNAAEVQGSEIVYFEGVAREITKEQQMKIDEKEREEHAKLEELAGHEIGRKSGEYTTDELEEWMQPGKLGEALMIGLRKIALDFGIRAAPVAGSKEAIIEMESMKSLAEEMGRRAKDEEFKSEAELVGSDGWVARVFEIVGDVASFTAEQTEHTAFAISQMWKDRTREGISEADNLLFMEFFDMEDAWQKTEGLTWEKSARDEVFYPLYLMSATLKAWKESWDLAFSGGSETDWDRTKRVVTLVGDKEFRKEMRGKYGEEDYAQLVFDIGWFISLKGIAAPAKMAIKESKAISLLTTVGRQMKRAFPRGASAFDKGYYGIRGFFEIKQSAERRALDAFEEINKTMKGAKGIAKELKPKLEARLKAFESIVEFSMAGTGEMAERGWLGRKLGKKILDEKMKLGDLDRWASEKAMEAFEGITDDLLIPLIKHIRAKGDIEWGIETGDKILIAEAKKKISKNPKIIETAKRTKKLTDFGHKAETAYKKGYFPSGEQKVIQELKERGWRRFRETEGKMPGTIEEARRWLASAAVREYKADIVDEVIKALPKKGDLALIRKVEMSLDRPGMYLTKEEVEAFKRVYEQILGEKLTGDLTKGIKKLLKQTELMSKYNEVTAFRDLLKEVAGDGKVTEGTFKSVLHAYDSAIAFYKKVELKPNPRWYFHLLRGHAERSMLEGMWKRPDLWTLVGKTPKDMKGITGEVLSFPSAWGEVREMLGEGAGKVKLPFEERVLRKRGIRESKIALKEYRRLKKVTPADKWPAVKTKWQREQLKKAYRPDLPIGFKGIREKGRAGIERGGKGLSDFADTIVSAQRNSFGKFKYDEIAKKLVKEGGRTKEEIHAIAYRTAKEWVNKVHFNYENLSTFDRIMKRIDPWWMYHSRRLAYFIDLGMRKPYVPIKTNQVWAIWEKNSIDKKGGIQVGGWIVPTRPWLEFRNLLTDIDQGKFRDPEPGPLNWLFAIAAHLGFSAFPIYEIILSHPKINLIEDRTWKSFAPLTFIPELFMPNWEGGLLEAGGFEGGNQKDKKERLVKKEIARQIMRKEKIDIEKARKMVERQLNIANLISWALGTTPKYHPEEDQEFDKLEKFYLNLPLSRRDFFVKNHPEIRAYWALNDKDEDGEPLSIGKFVTEATTEQKGDMPFTPESSGLLRINLKYKERLDALQSKLSDADMYAAERAWKETPPKQREAFLNDNPRLREWLRWKDEYRKLKNVKNEEVDAYLMENPTFKEYLSKYRIDPGFYMKYQNVKDVTFWRKAPDPMVNYEAWATYVRGTNYWGDDDEKSWQRYLVGKAKWAFWSGAPDPKKDYLAWVGYVRGTSFWTSKFEAGFQKYLTGQTAFKRYLAWQPYWELIGAGKKKEARDWFVKNKERLARQGLLSDKRNEMLELSTEFWSLSKKERAEFLTSHPELVEWWRRNDLPEETKLRGLIDNYFKLPKTERRGFLIRNPELRDYWVEQKRKLRTKTIEEFPELKNLIANYKTGIERARKIVEAKKIKGGKVREEVSAFRRINV